MIGAQPKSMPRNLQRAQSFIRGVKSRLSLPIIAAPMFLVSGPDLVIASARAGLIGAFPTANARDEATLDRWLARITESVNAIDTGSFAANLIVSSAYGRSKTDLNLLISHRVPLVITSIGSPVMVIEKVHAYGGSVFADVASLAHARRAVEAGVDGLVLLCAGAGGNCGWLNPFAFVAAVREFFEGPIAVAGCINSGRALRALEILGADYGYVGTPLIAATESMADQPYRDALICADADSIVLTSAVTGIPSNMLRSSLDRHGIDPASSGGAFHGLVAGEGILKQQGGAKPWRDVWTAGQGVGTVKASEPIAAIVARWQADYARAGKCWTTVSDHEFE